MPSKVYNNVEGHRVIDNKKVIEDITSVSLPAIEHPTTTISAGGMVMDVDMPDITHFAAMEYGISHNNGVNCKRLGTPGKHTTEVRIVRQKYNVAYGVLQHESVKYRLTGVHKSTDKGTVETGNPLGSTDKYSVLRYEEEVNGEITVVIDAMAGIIQFNGKDYASEVENLLK